MATRILMVDDEPVVTEVVERYLRLEDFEVSLASDGVEALRIAQEWVPDLVVLDLMLPGMDGLEVCRRIRKDSQVRGSVNILLIDSYCEGVSIKGPQKKL